VLVNLIRLFGQLKPSREAGRSGRASRPRQQTACCWSEKPRAPKPGAAAGRSSAPRAHYKGDVENAQFPGGGGVFGGLFPREFLLEPPAQPASLNGADRDVRQQGTALAIGTGPTIKRGNSRGTRREFPALRFFAGFLRLLLWHPRTDQRRIRQGNVWLCEVFSAVLLFCVLYVVLFYSRLGSARKRGREIGKPAGTFRCVGCECGVSRSCSRILPRTLDQPASRPR